MSKKLILFTDGGARGNPGPAALGVVLQNASGKIIKEVSQYLGEATNNQAEYQALVRGLEEAKKLKADEVSVFMDSELVVKQLSREYKVKDKELAKLFAQVCNLLNSFKRYKINHIARAANTRADMLVNRELDKMFDRKATLWYSAIS